MSLVGKADDAKVRAKGGAKTWEKEYWLVNNRKVNE